MPTFIWYSPKVAAGKKWIGENRTPWSADDLNTPVVVMDTTGTTYEWNQVRQACHHAGRCG